MKKDNSASFKQNSVLPWIEVRVANNSNACYQAHSHDEFSFGIIRQGSATYNNRNKSHLISVGDLVTINPADVHSCNPARKVWSYSMMFVDALKIGQMQQEIFEQGSQRLKMDYQPFSADYQRNELIKSHYLALFHALDGEYSRLNIETCVYNFVATSFSRFDSQLSQKADSIVVPY